MTNSTWGEWSGRSETRENSSTIAASSGGICAFEPRRFKNYQGQRRFEINNFGIKRYESRRQLQIIQQEDQNDVCFQWVKISPIQFKNKISSWDFNICG